MLTRHTEPVRAAPRMRRLLVTILCLLLWGFGTHGTYAGSGDEPHYLAIAHSIAFDGDLDVRNNYGAREPLIGGGALVPEMHVRESADGSQNPVHDVGLPLLFAPFVRIAAPAVSLVARHAPQELMRAAKLTPATLYRQVISLAMIALAAVLAAAMLDAFFAIGASPRAALGTTLLLMASPPLLAYSTLFFTELTSALLAFLTFDRLVLRPERVPRTWLAAGAMTGFLLLVHARNAGLAAGLTLVALYVLRREGIGRHVAAFVGPLVAMVGLRTAINLHLWGTWATTPHATIGSWAGWVDAIRQAGLRLTALMIDQEYGLLIYAPLYVLALAGFPILVRRAPGVAGALLVVAGCYLALVLLPMTNVHGWSGQWCPAGRFLTPIVPLLGLPIFYSLRTAPRVTAGVLLIQIALSAYWWQHPKMLWNDGDGRAAFCTTTGDRLCQVLPSYSPWLK